MTIVERHSITFAPAGIQKQRLLRVWPWTAAFAGELKGRVR
jgi:hypothetical protein